MKPQHISNEEFAKHVEMKTGCMSLLSKLHEVGLTKVQFKHLETSMGLSFDEINEILEWNSAEWKRILES